jgi:hypothetical protein
MTEQQQRDDETAVEDELDDTEQDGEEAEDGDDAEQAEPEWAPPTREQWEAAQAKLKRAREQARKLREAKQTSPAAQADPEATAAAQADVEKWQSRAVKTAAKAELLARGADPDMVELALGRLKVASVEFDDDDQPDLEDWLDDTQDRYPKLFRQAEAPAAQVRPKTGKVETPQGRPVRPKLSLGEQIMANSPVNVRRRS